MVVNSQSQHAIIPPGPKSHFLSDTKGHNGSFTSVLLHANSSSVLSDQSQATHRSSSDLLQQPRVVRGSCRKCIECTRLTDHRAVDQAKNLWPGQLASPLTYYTISRRRVEHQIASVPRTSRIWVQGAQHHTQRRRYGSHLSLATRRGVGSTLDDLMIPITRTNVPYKASNVTLVGVKTLSVSRVSSPTARKESKRRCTSRRRCDHMEGEEAVVVTSSTQPLKRSPFLSSSASVGAGQPMVVLDSRLASTADLNKQDSSSMIPVLLSRQSSGVMSVDDPTMQEYAQHQYAIKKEQAFACHHAIDIADVAKVHEEEIKSSSKKFFGFLASFLPTHT